MEVAFSNLARLDTAPFGHREPWQDNPEDRSDPRRGWLSAPSVGREVLEEQSAQALRFQFRDPVAHAFEGLEPERPLHVPGTSLHGLA